MQGRLLRLRAGGEDITGQMGLTVLPTRTLKLLTQGFHQALVVVGNHQIHARKAPLLQMREEGTPTRLAFAQVQSQQMAIALAVDAGGQKQALVTYASFLPYPDDESIHQDEGIAARLQGALTPEFDLGIKVLAQSGHGRFADTFATEFFQDRRDFTGGDTLHDHLHQTREQCCFAALVALEEIRGEGAVA